MKRPTRYPPWLERRGYSIHAKNRIAVGSLRSTIGASSDQAPEIGNVMRFSMRKTLYRATADCPEVSVLVLPKRGGRRP